MSVSINGSNVSYNPPIIYTGSVDFPGSSYWDASSYTYHVGAYNYDYTSVAFNINLLSGKTPFSSAPIVVATLVVPEGVGATAYPFIPLVKSVTNTGFSLYVFNVKAGITNVSASGFTINWIATEKTSAV